MTEVLDRIRGALVGLKMPRALEALDHTMQRLEQGEISGIEAIDALLSEEFATRETRRIEIALRTAKLMPIKTLEGFDFSFQPSLDRERIAALAQLDFIRRAEVVNFLGPPGTHPSRRRRHPRNAADHRRMELPVPEPADHRNPQSGEFYFGTFGEIPVGVDIRNSLARWRDRPSPITLPDLASSAANSVVVPWRL